MINDNKYVIGPVALTRSALELLIIRNIDMRNQNENLMQWLPKKNLCKVQGQDWNRAMTAQLS